MKVEGNKFWELMRESIIVQAIITMGTVGVVLYLVIINRPIPNELWGLVTLVVGFWFGTKVQSSIARGK